MAESPQPLTGYLILVFVISQFIAIFSCTNLGVVIAVTAADSLKGAGFIGVQLATCISGKSLDAQSFLQYLNTRYGELYNLA